MRRPVGPEVSMMFRWLPLALLLTACIEDRVTADPDPTASDGAPLTLVATRDGELHVVRLAPGAAEVEPFGPALPGVSPATHAVQHVWASGDRVLVALRGLEGTQPWVVLAGDGGEWRAIGDLSGDVWAVAPAPDLTRVWIERRDDQRRKNARLYDFDGRLLFGDGTFAPWDDAPRLVAWGPSWSLTFEGNRDLVRHDAGGRHVVRSYEPVEGVFRNLIVYAAFETSLLLWEDYPRLSWVDLDGNPIDVAGFDANQDELSGVYQIRGDDLERLTDRRVAPVQKLPSPVDEIVTHGDGWVLARSGTDLVVLGAEGERGRYHPAPTDRDGRVLRADGARRDESVGLLQVAPGSPLFVARVGHTLSSGDQADSAGVSYDLWRLDAGGPRSVRFRDYAVDAHDLLDPRFETGGAAVVWVEDGHLHRIDARTFAEATLDSDFAFLDFARTPDWQGH
jgi:hypothetical protein